VVAEIWIYSLVSVFLVSLVSLVGILFLGFSHKKLDKILIYLISFSAGALFGDAFIHLIPETAAELGFGLNLSLYILLGIVIFFILEKFIHWHHCHHPGHVHAFSYMILVGDGFHNFIDGLIIGVSYIVSIPVGIATTVAVLLHEIPQEIGDFGVLVSGGFSKGRALLLNFASALLALVGVVTALVLSGIIENLELILVPIAAGGFIYIAGSDLIPELHKHSEDFGKSLLQLISFIVGVGVMVALLVVG